MNPAQILNRIKDTLSNFLWTREYHALPLWKRFFIRSLQIGYGVIRAIREGQLSLRAMSLVYTTLITLVPLLAISFSVLKGFGFHNELKPRLEVMLEPLGEKRFEIVLRIIEFVDKVNVQVLGVVGLTLLIYSVVALMHKIEVSLNSTWNVARSRPLGERFFTYISVLLVTPLFLTLSAGLTSSFRAGSLLEAWGLGFAIGPMMSVVTFIVPWVITALAFTLIYYYIPNARIRLLSAFVGGLFAAFGWKFMGWLFAVFISNSANYVAIYAAFATLIIFMVWIYMSWLVILTGATVAFYFQNRKEVYALRTRAKMSPRGHEQLAVLICFLVARSLYDKLRMPAGHIEGIVQQLHDAEILSETDDPEPILVARAPFDTLPVSEVVKAVREDGETLDKMPRVREFFEAINATVTEGETALEQALGQYTVKDLVAKTPDRS